MSIAALVTWLLAASVGSYLLRTWIVNGGLRRHQTERPSRLAPGLIFGHGGLAASGLAVWVVYLVVAARALAWAAFGVLVSVATVVLVLLTSLRVGG